MNKRSSLLALISIICFAITALPAQAKKAKRVVIGYVEGYRGLINTDVIDVSRLTHLNYAFVDIKNNWAWLNKERTDTVNFRTLNLLKKKNPKLKILISIGGWGWSNNFSDAVLSDTSRAGFAASAVDIIAKYHLDGIDIDWEYPALRGAGNINRPVDKENYTLMFRDIRHDLDLLQQKTGQTYLLTTAVGAFPNYLKNTEMDQVQQYTDFISLMTYDYSGGAVTRHHTNLYPSLDYEKENSAHKAVTDFIAAGVPASKLVVGVAFYGRGWNIDSVGSNGFNQKILSQTRTGGYTYIRDSLINKNGYQYYWDDQAKAPFLLNAVTKQWISFDDERSVKEKCKYVKKHRLAGIMFWAYNDDLKEYLLKTIDQELR